MDRKESYWTMPSPTRSGQLPKKSLSASASETNAPARSETSGQGQADFPQEGHCTPEPGQTSAGWASGMQVVASMAAEE